MKFSSKAILLAVLLTVSISVKSQVLISLLFGEALNTDKIEFGLVGGMNRSYMMQLADADPKNNFNIGFYFHILAKNNSYISTGVLVKSNIGATGLPTYSRNDQAFDSIFQNGTLTKKVSYFYVPIMYHYRFNNTWYLEGGIQAGLRNKSKDYFDVETADGDLEYTYDSRDQFTRLDFGLVGGAGYKFKKQIKSTAIGINYYYGLVDVSLVEGTTINNASVYFYVKIPIGTKGDSGDKK